MADNECIWVMLHKDNNGAIRKEPFDDNSSSLIHAAFTCGENMVTVTHRGLVYNVFLDRLYTQCVKYLTRFRIQCLPLQKPVHKWYNRTDSGVEISCLTRQIEMWPDHSRSCDHIPVWCECNKNNDKYIYIDRPNGIALLVMKSNNSSVVHILLRAPTDNIYSQNGLDEAKHSCITLLERVKNNIKLNMMNELHTRDMDMDYEYVEPTGDPMWECAICLGGYTEGEQLARLSVCHNHCLHYECLKTWVTKYSNNSCPICRSRYKSRIYGQQPPSSSILLTMIDRRVTIIVYDGIQSDGDPFPGESYTGFLLYFTLPDDADGNTIGDMLDYVHSNNKLCYIRVNTDGTASVVSDLFELGSRFDYNSFLLNLRRECLIY